MEFVIVMETGEGTREEREYAFVMMAMDANVNDVESVVIEREAGDLTVFQITTGSRTSYGAIMRANRMRANAARV